MNLLRSQTECRMGRLELSGPDLAAGVDEASIHPGDKLLDMPTVRHPRACRRRLPRDRRDLHALRRTVGRGSDHGDTVRCPGTMPVFVCDRELRAPA